MEETGDYQAHARRQHQEAQQSAKEWIKTLDPRQRTKLIALGILSESDPYRVGGHAPGQTDDMAESPLARTESHIEDLDAPAEVFADEFNVSVETAARILEWHEEELISAQRTKEADLLGIVVGGLLSAKNTKITAAGLAFATGMAAVNGLGTPASFARELNVSRTILSKAVKAWRKSLNLPASPFQKSEAACATYSKVAKDRHWRKSKVSAAALMERLKKLRKPK